MKLVLVYMTAASEQEARGIGRALLEARLAACVNIIPGMASMYWWQGKIDEGSETVVIAKTRADLVPELTERVKALHSYTVPCVVSLGIEDGNRAFLDWIETETGPSAATA
jgi:periplasmic divalent cation tolerance protein